MSDAQAIIDVGFTVEGLHNWPAAPSHRAYLASPHRHLFHVSVRVAVKDDDREIEFHDLREQGRKTMVGYLDGGSFGGQSCEHLARRLATDLSNLHARPVTVHVSEDGEFGATVLVAP